MLAKLFKENEPDRSTAELLEKLFIGKDQTKFREFVNLVDRLISLMEPNTSINQVSTTWDITVKTLHRIKQRLHENQVAQIGKPTYSNSVMGGKLTPYPIASAILASPNIKVSAQYQGLCLLLIFHLLKNGSPRGYLKLATKIRQASNPYPPFLSILSLLPVFKNDLAKYSQELIKTLDNIPAGKTNKNVQELITSIKNLASKPIPVTSSSEVITTATSATNTRVKPLIEDTQYDSLQEQGILEIIQSPDTDNPPLSNTFIWTEKEADDDSPLPIEAIAAGAKNSRFWIRRDANTTKFDKSVLTGIERRRLSDFICNGLHSSDIEDKCSSLIVGMAYLSPFKINKVFELFSDSSQKEITQKGIIRTLPTLIDGYSC